MPMALTPATTRRNDPLLNHNFLISLLDSSSTLVQPGAVSPAAILEAIVGGFSECSGLEMTMQVEEYKEGGNNSRVLKFPGRITWSNITLKKGIGTSTALWDWYYDFVEGRGRRRDGIIMLLDDLRRPNIIWRFYSGLPAKYTGPALNAKENNVAIEALEIAHEGISQLPPQVSVR